MAGLFFAFSTAVMTALARLPAAQGLEAMNAINVVIVNPVFLTVFMGMALVALVLGAKALLGWGQPGAVWLLAGSLLYLIGIFAVTVAFNVPLNDALAAAGPTGAAGAWSGFLADWVPWNHVRTVSGIGALLCYALAR
jgi:uncharacterized membrane protein